MQRITAIGRVGERTARGALGLALWAVTFAVFALMVAAILPGEAHDGARSILSNAHLSASNLTGMLGAVVGMVTIPWQPALTKQQLDLLSNPIAAGQPEVVPWQLYDTQSAATTSAAPLVFFQTINADKTLSNMQGPGQLTDPQYMVVQYVACDFLQAPVAAVGAEPNAAIGNIENILKTCRATFEFNMSDKRYGPFSLTMCHGTGGGTANGFGTTAAGSSTVWSNNGNIGSGGFPVCGAIIIPPKIGFDVTIRFGTAMTLVGGPLNVRISLVGALYRRVL
jgi:hypothetical protein